MARPKKFKEPKIVNFQMENAEYEKLEIRVPNVSNFLRKCVSDFLDTDDNLNDLELALRQNEEEIQELKVENEIIKQKIQDIKAEQKRNAESKEVLNQLLTTANAVYENQFANAGGLPMDRVKAIAGNRYPLQKFVRELKKNSIPIIKKGEIKNSKIINANEVKPKPINEVTPIEKLVTKFNHNYNGINNNYTYGEYGRERYLGEHEQVFQIRCENAGIDFETFKSMVLK